MISGIPLEPQALDVAAFFFFSIYIMYVWFLIYVHTYIKYKLLPHQEIHTAGYKAIMVNETSFPFSRLPL